MVKIDLRGIAKVRAKGRTYYYAWRGGPRLVGQPGSPEFIASYNEAHDGRRQPDHNRFRSLVTAYRASTDYTKLAASTKATWAPWLDRIGEHFGELRIAQFDRPEKIRPIIRQWRNRYADKPRTADMGMQVLSRVLSYAVDPLGKIAANPCEGIKQLYTVDRSEIIWTDADVAQIKATCSIEIAHAVDLAAHTGLRQGDLLRLSWSHIGDDAIVIPTGKSRGRREALGAAVRRAARGVGAHPAALDHGVDQQLRGALDPRRLRQFVQQGEDRRRDAGRNLHFHDLRGTAATRFYTADYRSARSPKSWAGRRSTSPGSCAAMSGAPPRLRRSSARSTRPEGERSLQNRQQNRSLTAPAEPSLSHWKLWSGRWGSNPRHQAWEACVLPLNYARSRANCLVASM
jgi:integrase